MLSRAKGELGRRADLADELVGALVGSDRHVLMWQVRGLRQLLLERNIEPALLLFAPLDEVLELGDLFQQLCGFGLVLARLGPTDFLGGRVATRLRLLKPGQMPAASLVEPEELGREGCQPALSQAVVKRRGIVTDPFDVEHGDALGARTNGSHGSTYRASRRPGPADPRSVPWPWQPASRRRFLRL